MTQQDDQARVEEIRLKVKTVFETSEDCGSPSDRAVTRAMEDFEFLLSQLDAAKELAKRYQEQELLHREGLLRTQAENGQLRERVAGLEQECEVYRHNTALGAEDSGHPVSGDEDPI